MMVVLRSLGNGDAWISLSLCTAFLNVTAIIYP